MFSHATQPGDNPATFHERGVCVPFTTPLLMGTRTRPGAPDIGARARSRREARDRNRAREEGPNPNHGGGQEQVRGVELLVRNPAGGRGLYVLPPDSLSQVCRPTMYDQVLVDRLHDLPALAPLAVRAAARQVAAEGYAGRAAAAGAKASLARDAAQLQTTQAALRQALIRQTETPADGEPPADAVPSEVLAPRMARAVQRAGRRTGLDAAGMAAALAALTEGFVDPGPGSAAAAPSRLQGLLAELQELEACLMRWKAGCETENPAACLIHVAVRQSLAAARSTLAATARLAEDMPALLHLWARDRQAVAGLLARTGWVLDGWEPLCLLWQASAAPGTPRVMQERILAQMAVIVPVLPAEVAEWTGQRHEAEELSIRVGKNEDWRGGDAVLDGIRRNEQLLAQLS